MGIFFRNYGRLVCGFVILALAVPLALANLVSPAQGQHPLAIQEVKSGGKSAVILVLPEGIAPEERKRLIDDVTAGLAARADSLSLADLLAWERRIEAVREWPLDAPMLTRFALYAAIPLGSWLGSAVVERWLGVVLD